jgi:hypothetical protein
MCTYKRLVHYQRGYGNPCDSIPLSFRTRALNLAPEVHENFYAQVEKIIPTAYKVASPELNLFYLDICSNTALMVVYPIALENLFDLLNQTNFSLEMDHVLANNSIL